MIGSELIKSGIFTCWLLLLMMVVLMSNVDGKRRDKVRRVKKPSPQFMLTESNYTYNKGERAILYCSVKHLGTKYIIWRRANESNPLTIGVTTYINDKRFEIAHIDDSQDWNLMISNVTTAETGSYECQISAKDRDLRKTVHLHVKDEFSYGEPHIEIRGTLHVDRGRQLRLMCNATGTQTPPDYIDWFKDGRKIITDKQKMVELNKKVSINSKKITSIFTKRHATMNDTGTYICRTSDLQVTSVKVNVLDTNKSNRKRDPYGENENLTDGGGYPPGSSSAAMSTISPTSSVFYTIYSLAFLTAFHFAKR